jgi:hypothetical protein
MVCLIGFRIAAAGERSSSARHLTGCSGHREGEGEGHGACCLLFISSGVLTTSWNVAPVEQNFGIEDQENLTMNI